MTKKIAVVTTARTSFIDITDNIAGIVKNAKVTSGLCHLFVPHTTAGITINENADPSVQTDINAMLNKVIPFQAGYAHGEGNSAAHIKSTIVGQETTLLIEQGGLVLGRWQGIYFCEFDGPRRRTVFIKIVKTEP